MSIPNVGEVGLRDPHLETLNLASFLDPLNVFTEFFPRIDFFLLWLTGVLTYFTDRTFS